MTLTKEYLDSYRLAEETLLKAGVSAFPLDPTWFARKHGVLVVSYERFSAASGASMEELLALSPDGFCTLREGRYLIVYNRAVSSVGRKRWTILHELSHILLGHIDERHLTVQDRRQTVRVRLEREADQLTKCLIAPPPVALACGVEHPKELSMLFGLSKEAGEYLYRDYATLCTDRRILALGGEPLLSHCSRFFLEWQLKRFYFSNECRQRGKYGKTCDVSVIPEPEELAE